MSFLTLAGKDARRKLPAMNMSSTPISSTLPAPQATAPLIIGIPGTTLDQRAHQLLQQIKPAGFILFKRNCENAGQLKALCASLHAYSPLIFIDQEGGRVNRITWAEHYIAPPPQVFGALYAQNRSKGIEAVRLSAYVQAAQLASLGITVNCMPLADVRTPATHKVIDDRAFADTEGAVGALAAAYISGALAGGVWPVIKHFPGHGRATADSHDELPVVNTPAAELLSDLQPFALNGACPFIMTAHVRYTALDATHCATFSPTILHDMLRTQLGMTGVVVSDDLTMNALEGTLQSRAERALKAGNELLIIGDRRLQGRAMHDLLDDIADLKLTALTSATQARLRGLPALPTAQADDVAAAQQRLAEMLG